MYFSYIEISKKIVDTFYILGMTFHRWNYSSVHNLYELSWPIYFLTLKRNSMEGQRERSMQLAPNSWDKHSMTMIDDEIHIIYVILSGNLFNYYIVSGYCKINRWKSYTYPIQRLKINTTSPIIFKWSRARICKLTFESVRSVN